MDQLRPEDIKQALAQARKEVQKACSNAASTKDTELVGQWKQLQQSWADRRDSLLQLTATQDPKAAKRPGFALDRAQARFDHAPRPDDVQQEDVEAALDEAKHELHDIGAKLCKLKGAEHEHVREAWLKLREGWQKRRDVYKKRLDPRFIKAICDKQQESKPAQLAIEDQTQLAIEDRAQLAIQDQTQLAIEDRAQLAIEDRTQLSVKDHAQLAIKDQAQLPIGDSARPLTEKRGASPGMQVPTLVKVQRLEHVAVVPQNTPRSYPPQKPKVELPDPGSCFNVPATHTVWVQGPPADVFEGAGMAAYVQRKFACFGRCVVQIKAKRSPPGVYITYERLEDAAEAVRAMMLPGTHCVWHILQLTENQKLELVDVIGSATREVEFCELAKKESWRWWNSWSTMDPDADGDFYICANNKSQMTEGQFYTDFQFIMKELRLEIRDIRQILFRTKEGKPSQLYSFAQISGKIAIIERLGYFWVRGNYWTIAPKQAKKTDGRK